MANNASNYLEEKILQHIFNNNSSHSAFTAPADNAIFISLHSTAGPLDDNSGTGTEVPFDGATSTNYGYTRGGGTVSDLTWTVSESGGTVTAKNNEAIVFPQATNINRVSALIVMTFHLLYNGCYFIGEHNHLFGVWQMDSRSY